MVKVPIEVKKKLEQLNNQVNAMVLKVGELEMSKEQLKQQAMELARQRAQYWAQVCAEYNINPASSYAIEDDGEVKPVPSE